MERMDCEMEECKNKALLYFNGRWICGECLMKIKRKIESKFWENI